MKQVIFIFICLLLQLSCKTSQPQTSTEKTTADPSTNNNLIQDCPEELISNQMPSIGKPNANKSNQYYIYKGMRKEINEFDSVWVNNHCKMKVTIVH